MAIKNTPSILGDLANLGKRAPLAGGTSGQAAAERPVSEIWANVGYTTQGTDGDTIFVGLPYGIALDTMNMRELPKTNVKMRQLRTAQNALLEKMQRTGAELAPGESVVIQLEVEIRRNAVEEGITEADTALIKDLPF